MTKAGYSITSEGEVSLSAATAKSVIGAKGATDFGIDLQSWWVDFDGVTSSAEPVLVELCYATFATNSPGTNSAGLTERQLYGRVLTPGFTGGVNWTSEPTVLTVVDAFALDPNKGLFRYDYPLGQTPDSAFSEGYVLRLTAPATVSVRAGMRLERV